MNGDLERLINYAIVDGYISESEKEVLIKKAEAQGFDLDELELILRGKLSETKGIKNNELDKCPNCGDTISSITGVCPSCGYVTASTLADNKEFLDGELKELAESFYEFKNAPNPGASKVIWGVVKTICTAGLYIIYKKLIKKENLFDRYEQINNKKGSRVDLQLLTLKQSCGDDEKMNTYLTVIDNEKREIIKDRKKTDRILATITFVVIGFMIYLLPALGKIKFPEKVETSEQRAQKLINTKQLSKAKITIDSIEPGLKKDELVATVLNMEIDSLIDTHDYFTALSKARTIKNSVYGNELEQKIDEILEKRIYYLIDNKEFELAKEQAELTSYEKRNFLIKSIGIAESIEKKNKITEKKITTHKAKKRKR